MKLVKTKGKWNLYKVNYGYYEIWNGTVDNGVHVDNISNPDSLDWAVYELEQTSKRELEAEFGFKLGENWFTTESTIDHDTIPRYPKNYLKGVTS